MVVDIARFDQLCRSLRHERAGSVFSIFATAPFATASIAALLGTMSSRTPARRHWRPALRCRRP
jgi:hypothetical protein